MLVLGVDEAGYGPLLGPLVVAGAAFRLEDPAEPALGVRLRGVARPPGGRAAGRGLVVGDSKRIHDRARGLGSLESPLLAFAAAAGADAGDLQRLDRLLAAVGVDPAARQGRPWYGGDLDPFPRAGAAQDAAARGAGLARDLAARGVTFLGFTAAVLPEDRLNDRLRASGNKGDTLFDVSAEVLETLLRCRHEGEEALCVLDRHGGRTRYLPQFGRRWPDRFAWTLAESPDCSRYRLDLGGPTELRFQVGGDAAEPQVGLASMLAKYLRELFMELWNGWFAGLCPDVRATAGYAEDGRRWLEETRGVRERAGILDEQLVRIR